MEKIRIASLEIETDKLIKELKATKEGIAEITKENKQLAAVGKDTSKAFIRNEAEVKRLRGEYTKQIKILQAVTNGNTKLDEGLRKEVRTIDSAIANNKELRQVRNQINAETEEGASAIEAINEKINANTEFINDNASSLEKLKNNVGNYREDIRGALSDLNPFNGGLTNFIGKSKEAGGAGNLLKTTFTTITTGIGAATKAGLAFIATPIGAAIAVIAVTVGAFVGLIKNATGRSEEAGAKLDKIFGAVKGVANALLNALTPLGEFLIDGIVAGFEFATEAASKFRQIAAGVLDAIGFDGAAEAVREFDKSINDALESGAEYVKLQNEFDKAARIAQKTQLEFQKDAEKLRQIRDDESKTIAERKLANEELGVVLKNQLNTELDLAQAALLLANARIEQEGRTKDALDQQAEALTTIADIQERITGQESEQLVNRVALQKEAADKAKEASDRAIAQQKTELDLFIANQGVRAKTLQEDLELARKVSDEKIKILDAELKNRNITQSEYDLALVQLQNELAGKQAELAVDNAQRELDSYINANQSKLDSDILFSEEALRIEQERLNGLAEQRRAFEAVRLEEGIITEQEYNAAINTVNEENRVALEEAELERKEAKAVVDAIDYENQLALDTERLDFDLALSAQYIERERQQALADAKKTGADVALINAQFDRIELDNKQRVAQNKRDLASDTLGNLVTILGKESAAGKAAAVAQATIDTYSSAVSAFNSLSGIPIVGPVLGGIAAAAAVASGLQTVRKIVSTPKPSVPQAERGMMVGGRRHSQGGTLIEAEKGEAIMTRGAVAKHGALLSAINVDGGGIPFMEQGGTIGGITGSSTFSPSGLDVDVLAAKIAQANMSLPAPIVAVEEINTVSNRVQVAESASTL